MKSEEMISDGAKFSEEVMEGIFCRFCLRIFLDNHGQQKIQGAPSVCGDCYNKMRDNQFGYCVCYDQVNANPNRIELPDFFILEEIAAETDGDWDAAALYSDAQDLQENYKYTGILAGLQSRFGNNFSYDSVNAAFVMKITKKEILRYYPRTNRAYEEKTKLWHDNGAYYLRENYLKK